MNLELAVAEARHLASIDPPPAIQARNPRARWGVTPRWVHVLRLLVDGRSNPQIADELFIGRRTVETHLEAILRKIGVEGRAAAAESDRHEMG